MNNNNITICEINGDHDFIVIKIDNSIEPILITKLKTGEYSINYKGEGVLVNTKTKEIKR